MAFFVSFLQNAAAFLFLTAVAVLGSFLGVRLKKRSMARLGDKSEPSSDGPGEVQ